MFACIEWYIHWCDTYLECHVHIVCVCMYMCVYVHMLGHGFVLFCLWTSAGKAPIFMSMCFHLCLCSHVLICVWTCIYLHVGIWVYACICICVYIYLYIYGFVYTFVYEWRCVLHLHMWLCKCVCMCAVCMYGNLDMYTQTYIHRTYHNNTIMVVHNIHMHMPTDTQMSMCIYIC